jgi:alpha-1,3-rhamnosyl/mannosyltransferase
MRRRMQTLLPRTLRRAARVFALTGAMADEIAQAYRVDRSRIDVVAPGVDPRWFQKPTDAERDATLQKYGVPADYVLYAGAIQPRKNLGRLARAVASLKNRGLPHVLVLVGEAGWLSDVPRREIESADLNERLIRLNYVSAAELAHLFHGASAVAYLSLYEGFGLPVLEAMACGTPVLASDIPTIREVARDGALLVDPRDGSAIGEGLHRLLTDSNYRGQLRSAGIVRAREYTRTCMGRTALAGYRAAMA